MTIEQATPGDLPQLEALLALCPEAGLNPRSGLADGLRRLLEDPSLGRIAVARQNGRVIAMAGLATTVSTAQGGLVLWVEELWVDPAHRGDGCDARLLGHALDYARANGFSRVTFLPGSLSPQAERHLRDLGFESSGMIPLRRATFV